jgi:hypothetical protein
MTTKQQRILRTLLGLALMFIILGFANLFYGNHKYNVYAELLSKASSELTSTKTGRPGSLLPPSVNIDKQNQHINKLKARRNFYRLVTLGGKCFLALAGVLLLLGMLNFFQFYRSDDIDLQNQVDEDQ